MTSVDFVFSPEATARFFDVILCLARFSESVGIEARRGKLVLSALNSSKTARAAFAFEKATFFQSYRFSVQQSLDFRFDPGEERFTCRILNKAMHSAFKGRLVDSRDNDSSLERCEVSVKEGHDEKECRFVVKMIYRQGIKKTHKLTYEPIEPVRVTFDKEAVRSRWTIGAHALRAFTEYFGAKTEHLDMLYEDGRMHFTSYTEKVVHGKEILKQPLQTSVAIDSSDFETFEVEESQHVGISVKDFKAIVAHAETLRASATALYSQPSKPLMLTYSDHGLLGEFTLMTIGVYRGGSVTPTPSAQRAKPMKLPTRPDSAASARSQTTKTDMPPPPPRPGTTSFTRDGPSQRVEPTQPRPSINEESLFVTDEDEEERRWGARAYDEDEGELRWDSGSHLRGNSFAQSISLAQKEPGGGKGRDGDESIIAPTQRMSQIRGMFDE